MINSVWTLLIFNTCSESSTFMLYIDILNTCWKVSLQTAAVQCFLDLVGHCRHIFIGESCTRLLQYVILRYLALVLNICLTLFMFTTLLDLCGFSFSDTRILNTPNVKLKSYGHRSFVYHGPTAWKSLSLTPRHQHKSDCFKRDLKIHLFLSVNELNTGVVFCYFYLPTINTTLVINKLIHLSYYWH